MKALPWQIISGLLVVLLIVSVQRCSHWAADAKAKPGVEYVYIPPLPADTIVDSFPKPIYIDTGSYTLEVIKDEIDSTEFWGMIFEYLLTYGYDSVYKDDSTAYIRLQHEVTRNKLKLVKMIYENRIKQQIAIYDTCQPREKWAVYGGLFLGGGKQAVNAGPYMSFTQDKMNIWLSADLINKQINAGTGIKLFSNRKK